jgi:hypothetical protein
LSGWVQRYVAARGGAVRAVVTGTGFDLVGDDGSRASLALLDPDGWPAHPDGTGPADLEGLTTALATEASRSRTLLVCLVRRGGWSVGVVRDGAVLSGRTGRRYVQGGTAAGGWSQQRFARRRSGQAGKLADDASSAVVNALEQAPGAHAVVVGGDRRLADSVLEGTPAQPWPRLGPIEVGEPRRVDLDAAAERVRAVRVTVHDAPG